MDKINPQFIKDYEQIHDQLNQSLNENWERVIPKQLFQYGIPFLFYKHKSKDLVMYYDMELEYKGTIENGYLIKSKKKSNQPKFYIYKQNEFDYYGNWRMDNSQYDTFYKTFNGLIKYCNKI
jgi:hypothetical protein